MGQLDVLDGAFVLVDERGVRVHIPLGGLVCLMLEPGSRVSHAAVVLADRAGMLLIWVGEAGVRLYAAGQPGGARSDRLYQQAALTTTRGARCPKMYALCFGEDAPSIVRSISCAASKAHGMRMYRLLAARHGATWDGRNRDRTHGTQPIC
jgi:CRISPR-associated protein Cas1